MDKIIPLTNIHPGNHRWESRKGENSPLHCSYCGSITLAMAVELLATPGVEYSGSDWKYGWPHKFYFISKEHSQLKFYAEHVLDGTDDQLTLFNRLAEKTLSISYEITDEPASRSLCYRSPFGRGYQGAGTIGGPKVLG